MITNVLRRKCWSLEAIKYFIRMHFPRRRRLAKNNHPREETRKSRMMKILGQQWRKLEWERRTFQELWILTKKLILDGGIAVCWLENLKKTRNGFALFSIYKILFIPVSLPSLEKKKKAGANVAFGHKIFPSKCISQGDRVRRSAGWVAGWLVGKIQM